MISVAFDGAVTLTDDADFNRTQLIAAGTAAGVRDAAILAFFATGGIVPLEISMLQFRLALRALNRQTALDLAATTLGGDAAIWLQYTAKVQRQDPTLLALAASGGVTSNQLDALFRLAITK